MKNILVPVSIFENDANLLDYACSIAVKSQANLTLVYTGIKRWMKTASVFSYHSFEDPEQFLGDIKQPKVVRKVKNILAGLNEYGITYTFKYAPSRTISGITRECKQGSYDLMLASSLPAPGIRGYVQNTYLSMLMSETETPVLLVPAKTHFTSIENITYAVDLTDYDPEIVRQVKTIAAIFDARLTVVHINPHDKEALEAGTPEHDQYLDSLEQTILDTLDYPKINYKFFDYGDVFSGIKKFVNQSNPQMVAMTNRKKFTWSEFFATRSLTRRVAKELTVPLLTFRKSTQEVG